MIKLKASLASHDEWAQAQLKEVFEFKNIKAKIIINDVNYWTFGELQENIPEDYYSDASSASMDYQVKKIKRHYANFPDDCYIGFLHPWFGTGVLASGFGTPIVFNYKQDPAVGLSTIETIEEVKKLELPDPHKDGIMPKVINAIKYYKEHCDLTVGVTDCQGPLTTALSIIGYDKFCYWMHDYPKVMHEFMEKVTEALIQWVKFQKNLSGIPMEGECYPLGVKLPDGYGGAWLSDDDAVIIGTDLYKEFVVPYNSKFLKAFGGGCIHYCGTATQHIENYCNTEGLTVINNFNIDNIGEAVKIKEALAAKRIPYMACDFAPTDQRLRPYYHELFQSIGNQAGLIVASYVAPEVELNKGKYEACHKDQLELGLRVNEIIKQESEV
jgi:uroporphyrinogen decarboxylase-like protein